MGHSRITLAMLLTLGLLGAAQAQDPSHEPFFVELKGPDEPSQPATNSQPMPQPDAPRPVAQPRARQVATANATSYGPIRPTDTLWRLANKYRPSSRVSVYQTMVAIYTKNPRSFADGNINHILVGSHILLPTAAEAGIITDAEARAKFRSDNTNWKGLSPKYQANKQAQTAKQTPLASKTAVAKADPAKTAPLPKSNAAPPPAPAPDLKPQVVNSGATVTNAVTNANEGAPKEPVALAPSSAESTAPKPLPSDLDKPVGKPATEMTLALEDANAQLIQVTEMNHRLKLRLQSLTEEVETLKSQLQDQTTLQKELTELKAKSPPPVVDAPKPKQNWLMDLLASPLNLAMVILLPVLLVLALVTLWLRARANRELQEREKSLSESTAMMMDQEQDKFDTLLGVDLNDTDSQLLAPDLNTFDDAMSADPLLSAKSDEELIYSDDGEMDLPSPEPERMSTPDDLDLVPDLDLTRDEATDYVTNPATASLDELGHKAELGDETMQEDNALASLFDELEPELSNQDQRVAASDADLARFESNGTFDELASNNAIDLDVDERLDQMPPELGLGDPDGALTEEEPYRVEGSPSTQSQELDNPLESADPDIDVDDNGVGAKLDLARAYLEIDDTESALELLQEAADQGSDRQRAEAQKLLKRLA